VDHIAASSVGRKMEIANWPLEFALSGAMASFYALEQALELLGGVTLNLSGRRPS